jgi:hypothetical protein
MVCNARGFTVLVLDQQLLNVKAGNVPLLDMAYMFPAEVTCKNIYKQYL